MAHTIYATFENERDAERAAGALMDHGISAEDVSFVVPNQIPAHAPGTSQAGHVDAVPPRNVPLPDDIPVIDVYIPAPPPLPPLSLDNATRPMEPPEGVRAGYRYDALGAVIPDPTRGAPIPPAVDPAEAARAAIRPAASGRATIPADTPIDTVEHDRRSHIVDMNRMEPTAASGVSTSTGADAAKGAIGGASIGIGLGVILGIAAVAIPGVGLVAGAGALVAGLAAATGAAGGIAGGVFGYLTDLGLPAAAARRLSSNLERGGPVLSIEVTGPLSDEEIVRLLKKYGATSAEAF